MSVLVSQQSRRHFLSSTAIAALGIALIEHDTGADASDGQQMSESVLKHVGTETANIYNRVSARGHLQAEDVRSLKSNMALFFAHSDEVGLNSAWERQARENGQDVVEFVPSEGQLSALEEHMRALGAAMPREKLYAMWQSGIQRKTKALSRINQQGIRRSVQDGIFQLEKVAKELELRGSQPVGARFVSVSQDEIGCQNLQIFIDVFPVLSQESSRGSL